MGFWDDLWRFITGKKKPQPPPVPKRWLFRLTVISDHVVLPDILVTENSHPYVATTGANGVADFGELPQGDYSFCVDHADYHYKCVGVHLYQPTHIELWLDRKAPPPPEPKPAPPTTRLSADGRHFIRQTTAGARIFRPIWVSGFTLASKKADDRDRFLDWAQETGFNGVRVMVGSLSWAGQTPEAARAGLPVLLAAAEVRGLYVEVTALTGTASEPFNKEAHLREVAKICGDAPNAVVEIANEYYHGTQDAEVHDPAWLQRMGEKYLTPEKLAWAAGAPNRDEPTADGFPIQFGSYITAHLRRTGTQDPREWNMVRRVRELYAIYAATRKPVLNNEPIGWDEVNVSGRRSNNPSIAFAMGALGRIFDIGTVSHAEHGLRALLPGPKQQACHTALVRGATAIPTAAALSYRNTGHLGSPIQDADFESKALVRAYSGVTGARAWTILLGLKGDPKLKLGEGWKITDTLEEMPEVKLLALTKG